MRTASILIGLVVLIGISAVWFTSREERDPDEIACTLDALICPDGTAVGRVPPSCEFAACPTPESSDEPVEDPMIVIDSPRPGETVSSPITVTGRARGNWFFEASFPITIVNWDGLIIGEGFATAEGEWMTTEFVPFSGTVSYDIDPETPYARGAIIFRKDNPSGLPEHDDAREIPIFFEEIQRPASDAGMEFPTADDEITFCTMDARRCPDGSYVGRIPPSCAFAPCPGT